uniref:Uncharacterized protein n=1 Tax=Steinernema glaseri TaxID=37863 RepID=A0A1I7Z6M2_9BILA
MPQQPFVKKNIWKSFNPITAGAKSRRIFESPGEMGQVIVGLRGRPSGREESKIDGGGFRSIPQDLRGLIICMCP